MAVTTSQVQQLYIAYFNRPADFFGLTFQTAQANQFGLQFVADQFSKSPEYIATYAGKGIGDIVDTIYLNLFGRHAEPAGLKFWGDLLSDPKSGITVGNAAITIATGAINDDKVSVANKLIAANAFYASLDTSAEIVGYSGDAANSILKSWMSGVTTQASLDAAITPAALLAVSSAATAAHDQVASTLFTLGDGIDTFMGGSSNDRFVAANGTWTALDTVDGGAGVNSFTVAQDTAIAGAPAGSSVKNIDVFNVISGSTITLNASSFGVKALNVTAAGASAITAAATTDVAELNSKAASSITGGNNVTVSHSVGGNVTIDGAAGKVDVTSKTGTVSVNDALGATTVTAKGGSVTVDGKTINVATMDAVTRANIQAHISAASTASSANSTAVSASGNAVTVFNDVTALKTAVAAAGSFTAVATLTLAAYNNGDITRDQKIAIDAAFATGVKTDVATGQTAAAAIVTPIISSALADKTSTALTALSAAAALSAANTLVSDDTATGAGVNVADNGGKVLTTATVSGNFGSTVNLADNSTLQTTLTKVVLDNAGTAIVAGNGVTDVTITNSNKLVTINNTTANHTTSLTLSGVTSLGVDGGTTGFVDGAATTINVTSNGTVTNQLATLTAGQVTALNITGAAGFRASAAGLAANAVINAAASSGSNNLTLLNGQAYVGGTGADTVTTGTSLQTVAVDGGAGTADRLNVSNAATYTGTTATNGAVLFSNFEILGVTAAVVDVRDFTNSAFTSISTSGVSTINGLNTTQANAITATGSGALTLGVVGAATVGQLDTVHITTTNTSAAVALGVVGLNGVETLNLTANARGTGTSIDLSAATALTNVNIDGSREVTLTTGGLALNVNTVIDAHANTAVGRTVSIDASAATANGLKIIGSDVANNVLKLNGLSGVLQAGSGDNTLISLAGNDTIVAGSGDNTVNAGAGNNTITLGDGFNSIISLGGNDTITVGAGNNTIDSGAGADKIVLAAHSIGHVDYIQVAAAAAAGVNMDTITGFITSQDVLQLSVAGTALNGVTLVAGTSTGATMLATLTDATSVATIADVYTRLALDLDNSVGHEFALTTAAAGGIVAREVTFTTGAAAGTYLIVNDSVAGFIAANDVVIKLVGNTTIAGTDIVTIA